MVPCSLQASFTSTYFRESGGLSGSLLSALHLLLLLISGSWVDSVAPLQSQNSLLFFWPFRFLRIGYWGEFYQMYFGENLSAKVMSCSDAKEKKQLTIWNFLYRMIARNTLTQVDSMP